MIMEPGQQLLLPARPAFIWSSLMHRPEVSSGGAG